MVVQNLSDLSVVKRRAVIINYNTKHVTLLSLLSTLRYTAAPVLLIDCESTDGSYSFFESLLCKYPFDLIRAPLRKHGLTLDWLFSNIKDEEILLIDSDVEVLNNEIFSFLDKHILDDKIFGGGFLDGTGFLKQSNTLYFERPYMPFALFKVKYVLEALNAGRSFADVMVRNEYGQLSTKFTRVIRKIFEIFHAKPPQFFREKYFISYPEKVYYDTGAKIYEYLRFERFLFFLNLPETCHSKYMTHFWGVTRNIINSNENHVGDLVKNKKINEIIFDRLKCEYNEVV